MNGKVAKKLRKLALDLAREKSVSTPQLVEPNRRKIYKALKKDYSEHRINLI